MINPENFFNLLKQNEIDFFTGVPDSLLKDFNAYIMDHAGEDNHIIAANEGASIALAAGYHLATKKIALVYMQNSGLGNTINPLVSLMDKEVYSIPVLLIIGWRGEPGVKDEPQHVKQGKITLKMLETLGIQFDILPTDSMEKVQECVKKAVATMKTERVPYAIVVKKNSFEKYELKNKKNNSGYEIEREEAIRVIVSTMNSQDIVVSTTGMISRELFEYRESTGQNHERDFLTVGSMGHSSQIALTIALSKPERQVFCLDGDGAVIMHMGSLAIIGTKSPHNLKHIVLNNGAHDSVGGQPTVAFDIDIAAIAKSCGYKMAIKVKTKAELERAITTMKSAEGPCLLEVLVNKGHRKDLGRPTTSPIQNKESFMRFLSQ